MAAIRVSAGREKESSITDHAATSKRSDSDHEAGHRCTRGTWLLGVRGRTGVKGGQTNFLQCRQGEQSRPPPERVWRGIIEAQGCGVFYVCDSLFHGMIWLYKRLQGHSTER